MNVRMSSSVLAGATIRNTDSVSGALVICAIGSNAPAGRGKRWRVHWDSGNTAGRRGLSTA